MDRETAKQEVRANWRRFYSSDKKKKGIICPLCQSGTHEHGTGITENPRNRGQLKCWSCGFTGDVIDLYQKDTGADYSTSLNTLAAEIGITIDPYKPPTAAPFSRGKDYAKEFRAKNATERPQTDGKEKDDKKPAEKTKGEYGANMSAETLKDYSAYYRECMERITEPAAAEYLKKRGITAETAEAFLVGYDPKYINPSIIEQQRAKGSTWTPPATERIILPVAGNCYIARAIDPEEKIRYQNETGGGAMELFNLAALYAGAESVFICEGIFDALSIIEAGGTAVALNSTSNAERLINALQDRPTKSVLLLALDKDNAGEHARETIEKGLQRLNIAYSLAGNICGEYKDPNEYLIADREAFIKAVKAAERGENARKPDNTSAYIETGLQSDIERMQTAADRKTGFADFDRKSGGLYAGLYVIAALSSLGKTTFALQIADNLAAAGHDVLFFSLEQSRLELVSKSFARILYNKYWFSFDGKKAVTSLQLRKGENAEELKEAAAEYTAAVSDRMSIIEGNFKCDIAFIGEYIRKHIARTGNTPIVFIDYLQILQPAEDLQRKGAKEQIDYSVSQLKQLTRELDITLFAISSINRANYLTPIDFASLKESGGIEYTADVILGLQLACLNESMFDKETGIKAKRERIKEAKSSDPREIELVCLKNRYGISSFSCNYKYYPAHDCFTECQKVDPRIDTENPFEKNGRKDETGDSKKPRLHF